ncbi:MAG: fumarylacetoacetate hydrolase family protein, partial [Firmicutes bacterium]|nr:fumarylacetoacetate hydrolase family protein [Bacillota bacterium]
DHYDVLREECEREAAVRRREDLLSLKAPEVKLLSPIPYPRRNIVCLGKNYLAHVKEIGGITGGPKDTAPEWPIYFTKAAYPCLEPGGTILRHETVTKYIDYEAELTVVMGRQGLYIPEEEALEYVFGYTIGNDISARDVQNRHVNWFKGKSLTTHCPVGPWIVTADEIPDPQDLTVQSYVEGELRQDGNTRDMIRSVAAIIHELSQGYELFPGDMIMTGTPKGVGMGFDPPRYLQPGNEIKCVISQIGELTNYLEK